MAVNEALAIPAASKGAVVVLTHRHIGTAESNHVRPDLVHVGGTGKVDHVRGKAAAGAHVDFQRHDLTFFAHAGLIIGHAEELEVDKAALHPKALDGGTACGAGVLRQILDDVVDGVVIVVHDVHDGHGAYVARLKDGVAVGVNDGIVAVHLGADELLHDVSHIRVFFFLVGQKFFQFLVAGKAVGIRSAHAVVRLDYHRVAHLRHKGLAARKVIHHVVAGGGDTGLLIVLLHLALVLDAGHIRGLEAAGNVEIGAQGGIPFQPVFIVGLQPVDAAILEGEKGHGAVYLVVVFQTVHLVVLVQACL